MPCQGSQHTGVLGLVQPGWNAWRDHLWSEAFALPSHVEGGKENRRAGPPRSFPQGKKAKDVWPCPCGLPEESNCPRFQVVGKEDLILRKRLPIRQAIRNAGDICKRWSRERRDWLEEGRAEAREGTWLLFPECSLDVRKLHAFKCPHFPAEASNLYFSWPNNTSV